MEQKLQELLDKVYTEGVAKGQEVASTIVRDAERKAEHILEEARREAADVRRQASEEAEELKRNVASELRLSASQSIQALRQQISRLVLLEAVDKPVRDAFSDEDFIKGLIETLVANWHPGQDGQEGLALMLPEKSRESLGHYFSAKAQDALNASLRVDFDGRLESGFRIGPADGRYVISFTDSDFEMFFKDYLRPKTNAVLFGSD
ncbi:MAG: hypothetical protein KDD10_28285 [Phaeodactylibacter sp.]|nr:hypothetical protein [Phaeodactylibacter sp.]